MVLPFKSSINICVHACVRLHVRSTHLVRILVVKIYEKLLMTAIAIPGDTQVYTICSNHGLAPEINVYIENFHLAKYFNEQVV